MSRSLVTAVKSLSVSVPCRVGLRRLMLRGSEVRKLVNDLCVVIDPVLAHASV